MNTFVIGLGLLTAAEARLGSVEAQDKTSKYVATFDKATTDIDGEFEISIKDDGSVKYEVEFDLNDFTSFDQCDLTAGLGYHIHSTWTGGDVAGVSSAVAGACGGQSTKGHYDPFLACGKATSSVDECALLGRTAATYACDYSTNKASCEVGDLSGKYGKIMPKSSTDLKFKFKGEDALGPLDENYAVVESGLTKTWESVVFHCAAGGSRQFCAKFVKKD